MLAIDDAESELLDIMYEGDKRRDAASTIRGFMFQDYITIMCLLNPKVEYVCSEYLEDVDVFYFDGRFKFIQVKYYPRTAPNLEEITTDLYYQYLRLRVLNSKLTPKPRLFIHGMQGIVKPEFKKTINYLKLGKSLPSTIDYSNIKNPSSWLKTKVYEENGTENTKKDQKVALFREIASKKALEEFYSKFEIVNHPDINTYKEILLKRLSKEYLNEYTNVEKNQLNIVLLGLAVLYVQRRYTRSESDAFFEKIRIEKTAFDDYIKQSLRAKTDEMIVSYLVGVACEKRDTIVQYNDLSELEQYMMDRILENTTKWLQTNVNHPAGQRRLLYTISKETAKRLEQIEEKSLEDRFDYIKESKTAFRSFLAYLWKIMLNLCREKILLPEDIDEHKELFDPATFIVPEITDYICFTFHEEDVNAKQSIILPSEFENFPGAKREIVKRILHVEPRPQKWFMGNRNDMGRKFCHYDYSTAEIIENYTVTDIIEGRVFYVECMDCIKIEDGKWTEQEKCSDCIFNMNCVKGGKKP